MPVDRFQAIVEWLAGTFEVVPLTELLQRVLQGRSTGGLMAITFDDAYRGVFDHALPVLAARRLPSSVFVVSGFADTPVFTWWDVLGARGALTPERRTRALTEHLGLAERVLGAEPFGGVTLPDAFLPTPWDRILREIRTGFVTLGSHTVRHAALPTLRPQELEDELRGSREAILERTGREPDAVAYPYGLFTSRVVEAAGKAGYTTGLTLAGGLAHGGEDALSLPRINVPAGIPDEALACWTAGIRLRRA